MQETGKLSQSRSGQRRLNGQSESRENENKSLAGNCAMNIRTVRARYERGDPSRKSEVNPRGHRPRDGRVSDNVF